jgi:hypothetical protein
MVRRTAPSSTAIMVPVTSSAASEQRYAARKATSHARPSHPAGPLGRRLLRPLGSVGVAAEWRAINATLRRHMDSLAAVEDTLRTRLAVAGSWS